MILLRKLTHTDVHRWHFSHPSLSRREYGNISGHANISHHSTEGLISLTCWRFVVMKGYRVSNVLSSCYSKPKPKKRQIWGKTSCNVHETTEGSGHIYLSDTWESLNILQNNRDATRKRKQMCLFTARRSLHVCAWVNRDNQRPVLCCDI